MTYKTDEKDMAILDMLKEHGDYTVRKIAKKTNIAPTTVHSRIMKMKQDGLIKNFTVNIDKKKLGLDIGAFILISADVKVLKEKRKSQQDLSNDIKTMAGVEYVNVVTGETDLVAKVRVADLDQLDDLLLSGIQMLEGVSKTKTLIIIG